MRPLFVKLVPVKFEIEIKLRIPAGVSRIQRLLREHGFHVSKRRALESNVLFDNPRDPIGKRGKLIRLRRARSEAILTYKGPATESRFKKRHELEMVLDEPEVLQQILTGMGYQPMFRYEKYRTEYEQSSGGKVLLDETPIGNFLELEGSARWIDRTARLLGYSPDDYITQSYGYLHMAYCRERGIQPKDMLFKPRRNT